MLTVSNVKTGGWDAAIRGMRNPMNSWDMSDTDLSEPGTPRIGHNDLELMRKLVRAGNDHSKFMRMIDISMDIVAPLYWWKEYDTYKIGTVANSCSTMHRITAKEFEVDDFSHEYLGPGSMEVLKGTIDCLEHWRKVYFKTDEDRLRQFAWRQLIQLLPSSYNQRRTVKMNFQVARNIFHARKGHKLAEWGELIMVLGALPYGELITMDAAGDEE